MITYNNPYYTMRRRRLFFCLRQLETNMNVGDIWISGDCTHKESLVRMQKTNGLTNLNLTNLSNLKLD